MATQTMSLSTPLPSLDQKAAPPLEVKRHRNSMDCSTTVLGRPRLLSSFSVRSFSSHPKKPCSPTGLCVTPKGEFIVLYNTEKRIKVFSKMGQPLSEFGDKHLQNPWNLLVLRDSGDIVVSDPGDNSIKIFNKAYAFVREITGASRELQPYGMTQNTGDEIFVADKASNSIFIYNSLGEIIKTVKSPAASGGLFGQANYLCIDSENNIICSDAEDRCLKGFTIDGKRAFSIHESDMMPQGIAIDKFGQILVADSENACIKLFDNEGNFLRDLIKQEEGLQCPVAIALDKNYNLVVTDNKTEEIKVFSYLQ